MCWFLGNRLTLTSFEVLVEAGVDYGIEGAVGVRNVIGEEVELGVPIRQLKIEIKIAIGIGSVIYMWECWTKERSGPP